MPSCKRFSGGGSSAGVRLHLHCVLIGLCRKWYMCEFGDGKDGVVMYHASRPHPSMQFCSALLLIQVSSSMVFYTMFDISS